MNDFRYALRGLLRTPAYSLSVVAVLAAGMTLTVVTIAVVDGVLFNPLPFAKASELFVVQARATTEPEKPAQPASFAHINAMREALPALTFSAVSAATDAFVPSPVQEYWTAAIDERFFEATGQSPLLGGFRAQDFAWSWDVAESGGAWQPQLISHRVWRHVYGEDPGVVGRTFVTRESGRGLVGYRIVGVLRPDFVFPLDGGAAQPDRLVPISLALQTTAERRYHALVRIPTGGATAEIHDRLTAAVRSTRSGPPHGAPRPAAVLDHVQLVSIEDHLGGDERSAFRLTAAGAALLLALSCVNVAGLIAARNMTRRRETAVRRALGARGWHVVRALITEVLVLTLVATALALLLARPLLLWMLTLLPPTISLLKTPELDTRVFLIVVAAAAFIVALVALWPARLTVRITAVTVSNPLATAATMMARRPRNLLIAAQVAIAFVLVTAGGFALASFTAAWRTDAGFDRARLLLIEAFATRTSSPNDGFEQLAAARDRLISVGGVDAVAVSSIQPLFNRRSIAWTSFLPPGWSGASEGIAARYVTSNFFETMGLDLVRGRWPVEGEWRREQPVALVSENAARILWPGREALGQRLVNPRSKRDPEPIVIGIVQDAKYTALDGRPLADLYLPEPLCCGTYGVYFHVRTSRAGEEVLPTAIAAIGPGFRIEQAATHEDALFASIKHRALPAWVFGVTAVAAILVIAVGILGLLAVSVAQRTRELGIRLALGAHASALVRLIVSEHLPPVALGLAAGSLTSVNALRLARTSLYGVTPGDVTTWAVVALVVLSVSAFGILVPALRAARVNPIESLRAE